LCAPVTATAPQAAIGAPLAVNATVPALTTGLPSTVAVSATVPVADEGLSVLDTVVVVAARLAAFTDCESGALVDAALLALPAYEATIECAPAASVEVVHAAVRLLPLPLKLTAVHPLIDAPSEVNATPPLGALPLTVAVNVTLPPAGDGFCELPRLVVVGAGPLTLTTWDNAAFAEPTFKPSPP